MKKYLNRLKPCFIFAFDGLAATFCFLTNPKDIPLVPKRSISRPKGTGLSAKAKKNNPERGNTA